MLYLSIGNFIYYCAMRLLDKQKAGQYHKYIENMRKKEGDDVTGKGVYKMSVRAGTGFVSGTAERICADRNGYIGDRAGAGICSAGTVSGISAMRRK